MLTTRVERADLHGAYHLGDRCLAPAGSLNFFEESDLLEGNVSPTYR
jgi:hypothetical protein